MQRLLHVAFLILIVLAQGATRSPANQSQTIVIQPLGYYSAEDAVLIKQALAQFYNMPVQILPKIDLPKQAYTSRYKRYRAEKLLSFLDDLPNGAYRVVGLTDADISTTNGKIEDWGIIGLAVQPGRECVISTYRCRMKAADPAQARIRLAKVAVHEIGHTFGLDHCPTPNCLMQDARGSVKTCDRENDLCAHCRSLLEASGYALSESPHVPWLLR